MRVLVTGSTGFIGQALTQQLVRRGFQVRRAVRRPEAIDVVGSASAVVVGNIGPRTRWQEALRGVQVIVHLAGIAHLPQSSDASRQAYADVNVGGTASLAEAAAASGVKRMILVSSIGVNGPTSGGKPFQEEDVPRPHNAYAMSKLEAEQRLRETAAKHGLDWCIVRSPLVYGPNAPGNFARLMRYIALGWPLPLGSATAKRSFIALDNLLSVLIQALDQREASNSLFLASDGEAISTVDFVRGMAQAMGRRPLLLPVPAGVVRAAAGLLERQREVVSLFEPLEIDSSRLRARLQWSPVVTFREGMQRAVAAGHRREAPLL